MKLEWLHSFLAFAETLNFTRAAESLHLSQPALHVQIRRLSETIGVPLYRREGRRLELTAEGEKLAAFAREVDERSAEFLDDLRGGFAQQRVTLCAGEGAYLYLLGPALRSFIKQDPRRLTLMTADRKGTMEAVASGRAQLGVAALTVPPAAREELVSEVLTEVPLDVVFPKGAPRRRGKPRLADLDGTPLIVPPPGRPLRTTIEERFTEAGLRLNVAVEASGWEVMIQFVRLGIGWAVVNACCHVPRALERATLRELPPVRYYLLHRSDLRAGSLALRDRLLQHSKSWQNGR